jgi:hypothetical protein
MLDAVPLRILTPLGMTIYRMLWVIGVGKFYSPMFGLKRRKKENV